MTKLWDLHSSIVLRCTLESRCEDTVHVKCSYHNTIKISKKSGTSEVKEGEGAGRVSL